MNFIAIYKSVHTFEEVDQAVTKVLGSDNSREYTNAIINTTDIKNNHTITDISPSYRKLREMILYGKTIQSGTPTPTVPIALQSVINPNITVDDNTPISLSGITLNGFNDINDDIKIINNTVTQTKRLGVISLNGTETLQLTNWRPVAGYYACAYPVSLLNVKPVPINVVANIMCSHTQATTYATLFNTDTPTVGCCTFSDSSTYSIFIRVPSTIASNETEWKQWVVEQYANGTPVTFICELETPIIDNITNTSVGESLLDLVNTDFPFPTFTITAECDVLMEYNADINAVIANLQAQINQLTGSL